MTVFFETKPADDQMIDQFAGRIVQSPHSPYKDKLSAVIDLSLTHALVCPLNLRGLLAARDAFHDHFGIAAHIDSATPKFNPKFEPRYALAR